MKKIEYLGASERALKKLPIKIQEELLLQIDRVALGREPANWKPMKTIGQGVREIRVKDHSGIYRVIYLVKFKDVVHVLHAFQKKTQATSQKDIDIAKRNYRELAG